jgi:hypothetical protein
MIKKEVNSIPIDLSFTAVELAKKIVNKSYDYAELKISKNPLDQNIAQELAKQKKFKISTIHTCPSFLDSEWHMLFFDKETNFADIWSPGIEHLTNQ